MKGINILIVEDEKKIADSLQQGLSEFGAYTVTSSDGNDALQLFREQIFHVVLLDVNLPGMNGTDLCRAIRAINLEVPVIMLTAFSSVEDKIMGFDAGADDYIVKPFDFRELVIRIRALLKRANLDPGIGLVLSAGDLVMRLDNRTVTRGDKPVSLTVKEFQLLEYFLRNKNKVLTRANIALHVWGIDFDSGTNIIDVYVNYLRKKVDKNFEHPLIHTQVGVGYTLKE